MKFPVTYFPSLTDALQTAFSELGSIESQSQALIKIAWYYKVGNIENTISFPESGYVSISLPPERLAKFIERIGPPGEDIFKYTIELGFYKTSKINTPPLVFFRFEKSLKPNSKVSLFRKNIPIW
ncbi:hypothetical protein LEP1GSC047_0204 [Leptospira inadai serovar Lyme str. 10]|uniref:Uncharacterized protein n=2 Tax=Leptospira inadai serovar Lyme TaxID=293084 RepID=V6HQ40_9LEPT|nr:hypothetical protein LEP1GSC047_0204 [Leptospira inadai serovar Lyme str. 10]PNV72106.1 hypothetical protein BES34_019955 [Leptospira inadai serovar Lyme]